MFKSGQVGIPSSVSNCDGKRITEATSALRPVLYNPTKQSLPVTATHAIVDTETS